MDLIPGLNLIRLPTGHLKTVLCKNGDKKYSQRLHFSVDLLVSHCHNEKQDEFKSAD